MMRTSLSSPSVLLAQTVIPCRQLEAHSTILPVVYPFLMAVGHSKLPPHQGEGTTQLLVEVLYILGVACEVLLLKTVSKHQVNWKLGAPSKHELERSKTS